MKLIFFLCALLTLYSCSTGKAQSKDYTKNDLKINREVSEDKIETKFENLNLANKKENIDNEEKNQIKNFCFENFFVEKYSKLPRVTNKPECVLNENALSKNDYNIAKQFFLEAIDSINYDSEKKFSFSFGEFIAKEFTKSTPESELRFKNFCYKSKFIQELNHKIASAKDKILSNPNLCLDANAVEKIMGSGMTCAIYFSFTKNDFFQGMLQGCRENNEAKDCESKIKKFSNEYPGRILKEIEDNNLFN